MGFAELIGPLSVDRFMAEFYGKQPLHIPATPGHLRSTLLNWARFNHLLGIRPHWTEPNLKLIMNGRPVDARFYMDEVDTLGGRVQRANPAKVDVFLAMGASLVANSVEEISTEIREVTSALSDRFSGVAGANAYCSFHAVQAFQSHCDLHEVFALHCEGEKVWKIYENRAAAPVEQLLTEDAQEIIDAAKGKVIMQVRMRPGDLLYIPRGYYHDALASSQASLHLTFSVAPLTGKAIFRLLEEFAIQDPAFREYLPDAREAGGQPLRLRVEELSTKLAEIMSGNGLLSELGERQRRLWEPNHIFGLPERQRLEFYARTDKPAAIRDTQTGPILAFGGGRIDLGQLSEPVGWILGRPAFSLQELFARYRHLDQKELRAVVQKLERSALLFPYTPEL
jgi:lysine-specific demethylase/histidyl-hydroxylase NO66